MSNCGPTFDPCAPCGPCGPASPCGPCGPFYNPLGSLCIPEVIYPFYLILLKRFCENVCFSSAGHKCTQPVIFAPCHNVQPFALHPLAVPVLSLYNNHLVLCVARISFTANGPLLINMSYRVRRRYVNQN